MVGRYGGRRVESCPKFISSQTLAPTTHCVKIGRKILSGKKTLARATQWRKDPWIPTEKICANVTLLQDSTSQLLTVSNIEEVKLAQFDPKVT